METDCPSLFLPGQCLSLQYHTRQFAFCDDESLTRLGGPEADLPQGRQHCPALSIPECFLSSQLSSPSQPQPYSSSAFWDSLNQREEPEGSAWQAIASDGLSSSESSSYSSYREAFSLPLQKFREIESNPWLQSRRRRLEQKCHLVPVNSPQGLHMEP